MKLKVCLTVTLVCLFAFGAFAQHDHQQPQQQAPAMDAAAMEAMMKAGTPGADHKRLDAMAGTWDTKMSFWMMPNTPPSSGSGVATMQWVMGGRYLEQRFKGEFSGMPFEGLGYTGYDNVKKRYWGSWMDSMSTWAMTSTGSTSDGKTWTFTGSATDPMTGKDWTSRETITVQDADHHTMEMWGPGPDGKEFKMMEIQYTRKK